MSLVAREAITPTNQSPTFLIVTWVLQVAVVLAVAVKVSLIQTSVGVHSDDWAILAALVFSIGQVVAVSFQGLNGIGQVQESLSSSQLITYQKAGYVGELLFILVVASSKLSVVLFIHYVTPVRQYRRVAIAVGAFIIAWSLASLFVTAFECRGPNEWAFVEGQCIRQTAFWTSYSCINIVTELVLIAVPLQMFYTLLKSFSKKVVLMVCFSLRSTVVAAIAVQIYFLHHPVFPSTYSGANSSAIFRDDATFSTWPVLLTSQIIQCLSIITTCLPFMKSLFTGLKTGMIQTGHMSMVGPRWKDQSSRSGSGTPSWMFNSSLTRTTASSSTLIGSSNSSSSRSIGRGSRPPPVTLHLNDSDSRLLPGEDSPIRDSLVSPMTVPNGRMSYGMSQPTTALLSTNNTYTRRGVSMILEEDEEEPYWLEPDVETLQEQPAVELQLFLETDIPTWRFSGLSDYQ